MRKVVFFLSAAAVGLAVCGCATPDFYAGREPFTPNQAPNVQGPTSTVGGPGVNGVMLQP